MKNSIRLELRTHLLDTIEDLWSTDEIHFHAFNEDYYIIGYYQAKEWLKEHDLDTFEAIGICNDFEMEHFGEIQTSFDNAEKLVNHLVYPVGNPKFPFLGVHFTRMINGDREVGPNAVLAFKREGYKNTDVSINDMIDYLGYSGFLKFIGKNFTFCINEFSTSILKSSFLKKTQKLIPDIRNKDIKNGPAGVRAQGIDSNGNLMMDFEIKTHKNQIHIINAPSPAATSALSIADHILSLIHI